MDFEPVGLAVDVPIILQVKNGLPSDKPSAVIEYLKANRSKVSYGSPGRNFQSSCVYAV
jgi:tripartite-type tricarboxylate transporter receptor subunit TctC